jgi:deoxycytidylate deaminase
MTEISKGTKSQARVSSKSVRGELVFALTAAAGTDLGWFETVLMDHLARFQYETISIRLSEFLRDFDLSAAGITLRHDSEADRLTSYMDAGNAVRQLAQRGDILALFASLSINRSRGKRQRAFPRRAYVLRSLKHPEEVQTLRRIYGDGFYLIGVYSSENDRIRYLHEDKGIPEGEALRLIQRDQEEDNPLGQQTRDTFHLADVFISLQNDPKQALWRFLDLLFGHPYLTPTADESAMFAAYSASLRSADLSRQVGAVVTSAAGEVIAVGANDVPRFGGGLYWPGEDDCRDYVRGFDSNEHRRNEMILDVARRLRPDLKELSDQDVLNEGRRLLQGSPIFDLTEYGRAVHAEMEALLSCARSGVSPRGGTLYSTTFPCHNCAKHIVASGIRRVIYVEPYAKSRAKELHPDSICMEEPEKGKVCFQPFVGVSARRYFDLFSMALSGGYRTKRKEGGKIIPWDRSAARSRVGLSPLSYIQREQLAIGEIS